MPYLDLSDPEEIFGLLVDYVCEERQGSGAARRRFLSSLLRQLLDLQDRFHVLSAAERVLAVRSISDSVNAEDRDDPVVSHLDACGEELERITGG
jgi:hypothetical protein